MATSENGFTKIILLDTDIPECIRLTVENFQLPPEDVRSWFDCRVLNNPWQKALPGLGVGIKHDDRLIGFRSMFAQPWWLGGRSTVLAFAAHTAVSPDYRSKGIGSELIRDSIQFASITGSTSAGFITQKVYKKLGFHEIGGIGNDFFRTRVSFRGSLEKRLPGFLSRWITPLMDLSVQRRKRTATCAEKLYFEQVQQCGKEFDRLWERARNGYASCLERTSAYLNWRLFEYPTCRLHLASLKDASGTLRAFAVWNVKSFDASVRMAVLRDLFCSSDDAEALKGMVGSLFRHWRHQGISWANLEAASNILSPFFAKSGFELLPSQGNRYQIYSQAPLSRDVLENWFRSGLDGDYFDMPD